MNELTQFKEFPKMARLSRECWITEKIDGTNAQVFINDAALEDMADDPTILATIDNKTIRAGSRTRWITPSNDNYGFAKWVQENADELIKLGDGHHFGEWWGQGIQRGYGQKEKIFSLFNAARWTNAEDLPKCCRVVPVLYRGSFYTSIAELLIEKLKAEGSVAAPGFDKPEGVVVYHTAAAFFFKKTVEKDESPKSKTE